MLEDFSAWSWPLQGHQSIIVAVLFLGSIFENGTLKTVFFNVIVF